MSMNRLVEVLEAMAEIERMRIETINAISSDVKRVVSEGMKLACKLFRILDRLSTEINLNDFKITKVDDDANISQYKCREVKIQKLMPQGISMVCNTVDSSTIYITTSTLCSDDCSVCRVDDNVIEPSISLGWRARSVLSFLLTLLNEDNYKVILEKLVDIIRERRDRILRVVAMVEDLARKHQDVREFVTRLDIVLQASSNG